MSADNNNNKMADDAFEFSENEGFDAIDNPLKTLFKHSFTQSLFAATPKLTKKTISPHNTPKNVLCVDIDDNDNEIVKPSSYGTPVQRVKNEVKNEQKSPSSLTKSPLSSVQLNSQECVMLDGDIEETENRVDRILEKRIGDHGQVEYLFKWKDCGDEDNTWAEAEFLPKDLIDKFDKYGPTPVPKKISLVKKPNGGKKAEDASKKKVFLEELSPQKITPIKVKKKLVHYNTIGNMFFNTFGKKSAETNKEKLRELVDSTQRDEPKENRGENHFDSPNKDDSMNEELDYADLSDSDEENIKTETEQENVNQEQDISQSKEQICGSVMNKIINMCFTNESMLKECKWLSKYDFSKCPNDTALTADLEEEELNASNNLGLDFDKTISELLEKRKNLSDLEFFSIKQKNREKLEEDEDERIHRSKAKISAIGNVAFNLRGLIEDEQLKESNLSPVKINGGQLLRIEDCGKSIVYEAVLLAAKKSHWRKLDFDNEDTKCGLQTNSHNGVSNDIKPVLRHDGTIEPSETEKQDVKPFSQQQVTQDGWSSSEDDSDDDDDYNPRLDKRKKNSKRNDQPGAGGNGDLQAQVKLEQGEQDHKNVLASQVEMAPTETITISQGSQTARYIDYSHCNEVEDIMFPNGPPQIVQYLNNEERVERDKRLMIETEDIENIQEDEDAYMSEEDTDDAYSEHSDNEIVENNDIFISDNKTKRLDHCPCCTQELEWPKFAQHLILKHPEDEDVQKYERLEGNEQKNFLFELRNRGNFTHNIKVLTEGKGEVKLAKRPSPQSIRNDPQKLYNIKKYVPCHMCLGFYFQGDVGNHARNTCPKGEDANTKRRRKTNYYVKQGRFLLENAVNPETSEGLTAILAEMADDEIGQIVKTDELILAFGRAQCEKYENKNSSGIRQRMRQMARLLIVLKKQEGNLSKKLAKATGSKIYGNGGLKSWIVPDRFDDIVRATEFMASQNVCKKTGKILPSGIAICIGQTLRKLCSVLRGTAIRQEFNKENQEVMEKTARFLNLLDSEWGDKIVTKVQRALHDKTLNKVDAIPVTKDVQRLKEGVVTDLQEAIKAFKENPTPDLYRKLAEVTLVRIIIFNFRRSAEAAKMTLKNFKDALAHATEFEDSEILASLTDLEKRMADTFLLVKIKGARGKKNCPCLVTPDAKQALQLLIDKRHEMNVLEENPWVFGTLNSEDGVLSVSKSLAKYAQLYCDKPENITGTKLRKYLATACQMLELGETGKDYLANHLGHQIAENTQFYRQHADAVEVAKVSQILLLAEKGQLHKSAGRTINNLEVEDVLIDAEEMSEKSRKRKYGKYANENGEMVEGDDDDDEGIEVVGEKTTSDIEVLSSDSSDDEEATKSKDAEKIKDIDNEYGAHLSTGMLNVQKELLKNITSEFNEDDGLKRKLPPDMRPKKPDESLSVLKQIEEIEKEKEAKKKKLDQNAVFQREKVALIKQYTHQVMIRNLPLKTELSKYLEDSKCEMIISWKQAAEILKKEVDKIRKRENKINKHKVVNKVVS